MSTFTALYDACVLYPAPLRDLLMRLAITDLFRARWTDQIHEEWIRSVLEDRPDLTREQLERTKQLMNSHVRDSVVSGYEDLIDGLQLPDPDDRHVLAAAIRTRASVIVTFNGLEAQHPDEFITHLLDLNPAAVCSAAKKQRSAYSTWRFGPTIRPRTTSGALAFVFGRPIEHPGARGFLSD